MTLQRTGTEERMLDTMRASVCGRHGDLRDVLELKEVPVLGLRRGLLDVEANTRDDQPGHDRQYDFIFDGPGNKA
jgi:hypothetical protein